MERQLVIGGFYRHFKNKLYQVKAIAYHSETKEKMVVYQALYGDYSLYVRPYDMFMSEVDKKKYPDIYQKYRFEQIYPDGSDMPHVKAQERDDCNIVIMQAEKENNAAINSRYDNDNTSQNVIVQDNSIEHDNIQKKNDIESGGAEADTSIKHDSKYDRTDTIDSTSDIQEEQVNPLLMEFLDAEDYQQKLNTLTGMRSKLDDKLIDAMAASMEIEVPEGPIDKRYASLRSCILTHAKFECVRLRN